MELFRASGLASQVDIVERVLSFLPVPDVCRYRTVSKEWYDLLRNRHFIILHAQILAKSQDANFIVMRYVRCSYFPELPGENIFFDSGSCILDLKVKRWYRVKDLNHPRILRISNLVAMDGGQVCRRIHPWTGNVLIVHNLMDEEVKHLPVAPWHKTSQMRPEPGLVVDSISQTFKVFLINHSYDKTVKLNDPNTSEDERLQIQNDPLIRVYDSATNEWQSLTNPDWDIRVVPQLCCSVVFHGLIILLMVREDDLEYDPLWAYNLAEDKWKIIQADLDPNVGDNLNDLKLVVSANRLFLVSWSRRHPGAEWYFVVEEVKISERRIDPVYVLVREQVVSRFDIQLAVDGEIPKMIVIGFGTSLMVMSNASGKCKVFDVVTLSWDDDDLPPNPLSLLPDGEDRVWVGKNMNLLLPKTPW